MSRFNNKLIQHYLINIININILSKKYILLISDLFYELLLKVDPLKYINFVYQIFIMIIEEEDTEKISNILVFFNSIFEQCDDRIYVIVSDLLTRLYEIFIAEYSNNDIKLLVIILVYQGFKKLTHLNLTDDVKLESILQLILPVWFGIFTNILASSSKSNLNYKLYVLLILEEFFREYKTHSNTYLLSIMSNFWKILIETSNAFIWQECIGNDIKVGLNDSLAPINFKIKYQNDYNWDEGYELKENMNYHNEIYGMSCICLEILNNFILDGRLSNLIQSQMTYIMDITCRYLFITINEMGNWSENINQFISDEEDLLNYTNIKQSAFEVINNLIEYFGDYAVESLMLIIDCYLNNQNMETLLNKINYQKQELLKVIGDNILTYFDNIDFYFINKNDYLIVKKDVGMLLLGYFSDDIISYYINNNNNFSTENLIIEIYKELEINNNSNYYLISRILWVINKLYKGDITDYNLFYKIFSTVSNYLTNKFPYIIQLSASKTISVLAFKIAKLKLQDSIKNININYIENFKCLFKLFDIVDNNTLHIILDNLLLFLDIYDELFEYCNPFLNSFLTILYNNYKDSINSRIIMDILKRFITNNTTIHNFTHFFIPKFNNFCTQFINKMTHYGVDKFYSNDEYESDFLYYLLDILIELVNSFYNKKFDISKIENEILLINYLSINSKDPSVVIKSSIIIKNLVLYFGNSSIGDKIKIFSQQLIIRLLDVNEEEVICAYVGNLLLVYLQIFEFNIELIDLIIKKINKSVLPATNQGICVLFSVLFSKNFDRVVEALVAINVKNKIGIKILLHNWLIHQPKFIGKNTKNITLKTLFNIYNKHNQIIENMLTVGINPSKSSNNPEIQVNLKIIIILIKALDNEIKSKNVIKNNEKSFEINDNYEENNRLETVNDDDDYKLEVESNNSYLNEENINPSFNKNKNNNCKSSQFLSESQSYLSGIINYDLMDYDECDETTENDINILMPNITQIENKQLLEDNFRYLIQNDPIFRSDLNKIDSEYVKIINYLFN